MNQINWKDQLKKREYRRLANWCIGRCFGWNPTCGLKPRCGGRCAKRISKWNVAEEKFRCNCYFWWQNHVYIGFHNCTITRSASPTNECGLTLCWYQSGKRNYTCRKFASKPSLIEPQFLLEMIEDWRAMALKIFGQDCVLFWCPLLCQID